MGNELIMGILSSRFSVPFFGTKNPDVYKKQLEKLNQEILVIEKKKMKLQYQYNTILQFIVAYSRLLYVLVACVFCFSSLPSSFMEYIMFCGPLIVFHFIKGLNIILGILSARQIIRKSKNLPQEGKKSSYSLHQHIIHGAMVEWFNIEDVLIYFLKGGLKWYFDQEVRQKSEQIRKLNFEKKNIICKVKENAKFKDVQEILEFNREVLGRREPSAELDRMQPPERNYPGVKTETALQSVVDFVFGEEKNALICRFCKWHNGMALEEEYEYVGYRCCNCFNLNHPLKRRTT